MVLLRYSAFLTTFPVASASAYTEINFSSMFAGSGRAPTRAVSPSRPHFRHECRKTNLTFERMHTGGKKSAFTAPSAPPNTEQKSAVATQWKKTTSLKNMKKTIIECSLRPLPSRIPLGAINAFGRACESELSSIYAVHKMVKSWLHWALEC